MTNKKDNEDKNGHLAFVDVEALVGKLLERNKDLVRYYEERFSPQGFRLELERIASFRAASTTDPGFIHELYEKLSRDKNAPEGKNALKISTEKLIQDTDTVKAQLNKLKPTSTDATPTIKPLRPKGPGI